MAAVTTSSVSHSRTLRLRPPVPNAVPSTTVISTTEYVNDIMSGFADYLKEHLEKEGILDENGLCDAIAQELYGPPYTDSKGRERRQAYEIATAKRIVDNRYTCLGWRNFTYLVWRILDTMEANRKKVANDSEAKREAIEHGVWNEGATYEYKQAVDNYLDSLCTKRRLVSQSYRLLYCILCIAPTVMSKGTNDGTVWYQYQSGIWSPCSPDTISAMVLNLGYDKCLEGLGLDVLFRPSLKIVATFTNVGNLEHILNKQAVVVCDTVTYCRRTNVTRLQLPGDLSTMKMGYDPTSNDEEYAEKLDRMLDIFKGWLKDEDTVEFHLLCLAAALTGRFTMRWANVLYGTGSDGKSTIIKIIFGVFGLYSCIAPAGLYSKAHMDPDAPTPSLHMTRDKLIVLIPDMGKDFKLGGHLFMQQTGSDATYSRGLFKEGDNSDHKPYILMACDKRTSPLELSHLTRVKITTLDTVKRAAKGDLSIMPAHLSKKFKAGIAEYADIFLKEYATVLLRYILTKVRAVMEDKDIVRMSEKVKLDTEEWINSNPVGAFCRRYLVKLDQDDEDLLRLEETERRNTGRGLTEEDVGSTLLEPSLHKLFVLWAAETSRGRLPKEGVYDFRSFASSVNLFERVGNRKVNGVDQSYVVGKKIVATMTSLNLIAGNIPALLGMDTNSYYNTDFQSSYRSEGF